MYYITANNGTSSDGFPLQETVIKTYPTIYQCETWCILKGYVYDSYRCRLLDSKFKIRSD